MITEDKIESMLKESWEDFIKYFDINAAKYSREYFHELISKSWTEKKAKEEVNGSHWICWNESDLMMQLSRYFYFQREIKSVSNNELLDIEVHLDKKLNYSNFQGYLFDDKLEKNGKLYKELGRFPKLDLIITTEGGLGPFLLCAEAKHFHCSVMYGTVDEVIEKDIKTLAVIKKLGITDAIAYIILDDYYYIHGQKDLKELAYEYSKKHGTGDELRILYHNSKSKLIDV